MSKRCLEDDLFASACKTHFRMAGSSLDRETSGEEESIGSAPSTPGRSQSTEVGGPSDGAIWVPTGDDVDDSKTAGPICTNHGLPRLFSAGLLHRKMVHSIIHGLGPAKSGDFYRRILDCNREEAGTLGGVGHYISAIHKLNVGDEDRSHIHVVHDCPSYTESHRLCRCTALRRLGPIGSGIKHEYFNRPEFKHVQKLCVYLQKGARSINQVHLNDRTYRSASDAECESLEIQCGCTPERSYARYGMADEEGEQIPFLGYKSCGGDGSDNVEPQRKRLRGKRPGKSPQQLQGEAVQAFIIKYQPVNEQAVDECREFQTEFPDLLWDPVRRKHCVEVAWKLAISQWNELPLEEIGRLRYNVPAHYRHSRQTYYDPQYSARLLAAIALEQNGGILSKAQMFIENIINVVNRVVPKVNTICVVSAPSAGKSFFFDPLLDLCWTKGGIRNPVKGSSDFCYQDGVGKRINNWNECNMLGSSFVDSAKQIWEGQDATVNVKHRSGTVLKRTPLIVTANKIPWSMVPGESKAFMDRCYFYKWKSLPGLKDCSAYPCPLGWALLINCYQTDTWWNDLPNLLDYNPDDEAFFKDWFDAEENAGNI